MKIAYISSPYLADSDLPLLRALVASGEEVVFFLLVSPSSQQATVVNIPSLLPVAGLVAAERYPSLSALQRYLPLRQIVVVQTPVAHDWHPASLHTIVALYRHLRREHYDVVHLTSPLRYGAFLLYPLHRRMVLTMHDPLPHSSDRGSLNRLHRWLAFRMVRHFIVLSDRLREEFVRSEHLEQKNVYTTGLNIYDSLQHVAPVPLSLPERYVLFVGSIAPHKGLQYLCEAMREVQQQDSNLWLVVAGRGTFYFDIAPYTATLHMHLLHRFVSDGELVSLLRGALCVVCPYVDATQSGVVLSSLALHTPVVATTTGALPDMFVADEEGLFVPPRDSHALAEALLHMAEEGVAPTMAQHIATTRGDGQEAWAAIAAQTVAVYRHVADKAEKKPSQEGCAYCHVRAGRKLYK